MNRAEKKAHEREKFLSELTALAHKYKITIGGCGCCGSPWITDMEKGERQNAHYTAENDELKWNGK